MVLAALSARINSNQQYKLYFPIVDDKEDLSYIAVPYISAIEAGREHGVVVVGRRAL